MEQRSSRTNWIQACHFHPVQESEVFIELGRRISRGKSSKEVLSISSQDRPVVLLDLDSTLYEVGPRTFKILQEWLDSSSARSFQKVSEALRRIPEEGIGYSIRDLFLSVGLSLEGGVQSASEQASVHAVFHELKEFWSKRFFTSQYLPFDRPYPHAARFARRLHAQGAEIVYLTGRDEPFMGDGTRSNLLRDGFPWGVERTHLLMKEGPSFPDLEHKKGAAQYVRRQGNLVASFENEPVNLVALYDLFPEAMHVFVDTVCSDHEAPVRQGLYRIKGFEGFAE